MAARPLVARLHAFAKPSSPILRVTALKTTRQAPTLQAHAKHQRPFHTTTRNSVISTTTSTGGGNPSQSIGTTGSQINQSPELETTHAAYLGEADSNDGFETYRDAYAPPPPALDATNAAFLGEADSDDGFESQKEVHGQKLDSIDASQSAYLGEADSDDGFESDKDLNPERHQHKIEDASPSGLHGQTGEHDQ